MPIGHDTESYLLLNARQQLRQSGNPNLMETQIISRGGDTRLMPRVGAPLTSGMDAGVIPGRSVFGDVREPPASRFRSTLPTAANPNPIGYGSPVDLPSSRSILPTPESLNLPSTGSPVTPPPPASAKNPVTPPPSTGSPVTPPPTAPRATTAPVPPPPASAKNPVTPPPSTGSPVTPPSPASARNPVTPPPSTGSPVTPPKNAKPQNKPTLPTPLDHRRIVNVNTTFAPEYRAVNVNQTVPAVPIPNISGKSAVKGVMTPPPLKDPAALADWGRQTGSQVVGSTKRLRDKLIGSPNSTTRRARGVRTGLIVGAGMTAAAAIRNTGAATSSGSQSLYRY